MADPPCGGVFDKSHNRPASSARRLVIEAVTARDALVRGLWPPAPVSRAPDRGRGDTAPAYRGRGAPAAVTGRADPAVPATRL